MSPDKPHPTSDQIRAAIDSGRTGGKVNALDPAAAPLGTDAEAGGTPPTPEERMQTFVDEVRDPYPRRPASANDAMPLWRSGNASTWAILLALAGAIVGATILLSQGV